MSKHDPLNEADLIRDARASLTISDRTKFKTSIACAAGICATIICSTWAVHSFFDDFKSSLDTQFTELKTSQAKMLTALDYRWTDSQMEQFANQLDKTNRDLVHTDRSITGLNVPDPVSIATKTATPPQ